MRARAVRVNGLLLDGVLAATCLASAVWPGMQSGLFDGNTPWFAWNAPTGLEAGAGVVAAAAVFIRRRWPVAFSGCVLGLWGLTTGWPALLIAQYGVGAYLRSTSLRIAVTTITVLGVAWPLWRVAGADGSMPLSVALCILPMLVGMYLTSRREILANLEERAQLRIEQARAEERAQIARDMHDVVTHRVSLMVLHATALEADGTDRVEIAQRIQGIGRTALTELRTLVGVLRADSEAPLRPQPGLADLDELVAKSRELGLEVKLSVDPEVRASSMVEHAVYRVVQEALTNVHRHAPAAQTTVAVDADGDQVRLLVRNDGGPAPPGRKLPSAGPAGGHGLLGIAERVRLVGGTLTTRRTADGGFEVSASMPEATG